MTDNYRPVSNAFIVDENLELKDAGLVASDGASSVDGAAKELTLGTGRVEGDVIIDVTAVEIASNDEVYKVVSQFSNDDFTTIVNGSIFEFAATEVAAGGGEDAAIGRYKLPVTNVINDVHYSKMRLFNDVAGTITTGINYSAHLAIR